MNYKEAKEITEDWVRLIRELDWHTVDRARLRSGLFYLDKELEQYRDPIKKQKQLNYLTRKIKNINKKENLLWEKYREALNWISVAEKDRLMGGKGLI